MSVWSVCVWVYGMTVYGWIDWYVWGCGMCVYGCMKCVCMGVWNVCIGVLSLYEFVECV